MLLAAAAVVVGVGAFLFVGFGPARRANLGPEVFRIKAVTVSDNAPLFQADPLGRGRDIWLTEIDGRFLAFAARGPSTCVVEWQPPEFVDSCDGTAYPADGTGLLHYPVVVDDDDLAIDINFLER